MIDLLTAVDAAFAETSRGLRQWDDPHDGEMPAEDEYSRCTDPAKWRIIGARADAWIHVLTAAGLATVELDVTLTWLRDVPAPRRSDLVIPVAAGALTLAVGRTAAGDGTDWGVVIGVAGSGGLLAVVCFLPDCGCDACDSGSANELVLVDDAIGSVVSGTFRHLTRGESSITVTDRGRGARNLRRRGRGRTRDEIDRVLADPTGWHEITGTAWR